MRGATNPTTAELIAALHEIPKTDRDYRRALLVIDRLGTHEAELAAERGKVAALAAAWPDTESYGPILDEHEGGTWWLETLRGDRWPKCHPGPYETREAAVMAHLAASGPKGGATT